MLCVEVGANFEIFSKRMFPPGLEPGTFRVLGERDNHYTTETCFIDSKNAYYSRAPPDLPIHFPALSLRFCFVYKQHSTILVLLYFSKELYGVYARKISPTSFTLEFIITILAESLVQSENYSHRKRSDSQAKYHARLNFR